MSNLSRARIVVIGAGERGDCRRRIAAQDGSCGRDCSRLPGGGTPVLPPQFDPLPGRRNRSRKSLHPSGGVVPGTADPAHAGQGSRGTSPGGSRPPAAGRHSSLLRQAPAGGRCSSLYSADPRSGSPGGHQRTNTRRRGLSPESVPGRGTLRLYRRRVTRPGDCRSVGPARGQRDALGRPWVALAAATEPAGWKNPRRSRRPNRACAAFQGGDPRDPRR